MGGQTSSAIRVRANALVIVEFCQRGLRPILRPMPTTRTLARVGLATTLLLVAFGAFTRGSGSGFGCADRWPLCEGGALGGLLPRFEFEMIIEWTHRWIAAVVGLIAVATAVQAWRRHRADNTIVLTSVLAVAAIGLQAWIGRAVVKADLDADLVSLHLAISMSIVALFVIVVVATSPELWSPDPVSPRWITRYGIGAVAAFTVLLLGSLVHNQYVAGWPLVEGAWIPEFSSSLVLVHWTHRLAAGLGFPYFAWLWYAARAERRPLPELRLAAWSFWLYAVNIAVGLLHVLTEVESSTVVTLHLAVSSLVWTAMVGATALALRRQVALQPA